MLTEPQFNLYRVPHDPSICCGNVGIVGMQMFCTGPIHLTQGHCDTDSPCSLLHGNPIGMTMEEFFELKRKEASEPGA